MNLGTQFRGVLAVTVLITCLCRGQAYSAQEPAFSASLAAIPKAFAKLDAGSNAATVLLEDDRFDFDAPNRYTYHHRIIFKVWTKNGAQEWSTVQQSWAPWQEERPKVRARVITPDGIAHELDQKTVADSPARDNDSAIFT